MYVVMNKYTDRKTYEGPSKVNAKAAYRRDPTGSWVYKDGRFCDLRTFEPK
jgi:hypothetical protein